jgi:hypothetical protein
VPSVLSKNFIIESTEASDVVLRGKATILENAEQPMVVDTQ